MALSKSKLKSNLETWMNSFYSISTSATELANHYDDYALDAVDVTGDLPDSVFPGAMATTIENMWTIGNTYTEGADAVETGVQDYWDGGTFQLQYPPDGAVTESVADVIEVPPEDSITTDLAQLGDDAASTPITSIPDLAGEWADILHSATEQVVVYNEGEDSNGNTVTDQGPIT